MAKHQVLADVGIFDVGMVDVVFKVVRNGRLFGRLKVSPGSVEWMQRGNKKRARQLGWQRLKEAFLERGREVKASGLHGPLRRWQT
jgi:hypothetical protein